MVVKNLKSILIVMVLFSLLVLTAYYPIARLADADIGEEPFDNTGWAVIERGANFVRRQNIDNPTIFSWESAPQWFYNGMAWVPYVFMDKYEIDNYYQVQNGLVGARFYDYYVEFYSPDFKEIRVHDERWEVQEFKKNKWTGIGAQSETPLFSVAEGENDITITKTFTSWAGILKIDYIFREGSAMKHDVTFTSSQSDNHTYRVVQQWTGIVSTKVKHDSGIDTIVALTTINSSRFKFLKADGNLSVFENQWDMYYNGITRRYPVLENQNLKPVEIDVHAQGLKVDFVFGNWTLSQDESLTIDPDTATLDDPTEDGYAVWEWEAHYRDNTDTCIYFGGYGEGAWCDDERGYVEWDISSLAGATLTANPVFKYEGADDYATDEEINPITEEQPSDGGCTDRTLRLYSKWNSLC